ncbi:hypothetical protein ACEE06_12185, partial [Staphylococcus epidermidis]
GGLPGRVVGGVRLVKETGGSESLGLIKLDSFLNVLKNQSRNECKVENKIKCITKILRGIFNENKKRI